MIPAVITLEPQIAAAESAYGVVFDREGAVSASMNNLTVIHLPQRFPCPPGPWDPGPWLLSGIGFLDTNTPSSFQRFMPLSITRTANGSAFNTANFLNTTSGGIIASAPAFPRAATPNPNVGNPQMLLIEPSVHISSVTWGNRSVTVTGSLDVSVFFFDIDVCDFNVTITW